MEWCGVWGLPCRCDVRASWAKFSPTVKESAGKTKGNAATGRGKRYLARALGEAAVGTSRTNTFLGERFRRIARRRGKQRAGFPLVAWRHRL